ncbi:MAG: hypothetical protein JW846_07090 [Dehalococcoidia bacterium]|nr:hypothetical protein [Dehalococcoidia bacterium]
MIAANPLHGGTYALPPAASEAFGGLGPLGLATVIFLVVFGGIVIVWLIKNTGRRD